MVHEGADGAGAGLVTVPPIVHGCQGNKEPKDQYQEEQETKDKPPDAKQPTFSAGGAREVGDGGRCEGEGYVSEKKYREGVREKAGQEYFDNIFSLSPMTYVRS